MIGFFGDSFIDASHNLSWPKLVGNIIDEPCSFFGLSGTSQWYSFELFLKNLHKFDTIIFCHTSIARWPALPKEQHGKHFNIGYSNIKTDWYLNQINGFYNDIFPKNLLTFLCKSIGDYVNAECKTNKKYLINLIPFKLPYEIKTDFPIIHNMCDISKKEFTIFNNQKEFITDWIAGKNIVDPRPCHINYENNIQLCSIILNLIKEKTMNYNLDLNTLEWNFHNEQINYQLKEMYEKSISNR